jgi:hypothetical protein
MIIMIKKLKTPIKIAEECNNEQFLEIANKSLNTLIDEITP